MTWCYNLGMASLPMGPISSPEALERRRRAQYIFLDTMIDEGKDYREVAEVLGKGDPKKAKRWRSRWRLWITEPEFQGQLAAICMGELRAGLPASIAALVRRASKGNVPAIKLAMEASGFYNPRMEHHHSGKIEVELKGVPRPAPTTDEDHSNEATIYEADVVEE
jgi:hypothetical protein